MMLVMSFITRCVVCGEKKMGYFGQLGQAYETPKTDRVIIIMTFFSLPLFLLHLINCLISLLPPSFCFRAGI